MVFLLYLHLLLSNKMKIHNRINLKETRRVLRKNLTPAEALLWKALKNRQLKGRKFRRQHSVGNYILDFYCPSEKLNIELDGMPHFTIIGEKKDKKRDEYLKTFGIKIIRFENRDLYNNLTGVLEIIQEHFNE